MILLYRIELYFFNFDIKITSSLQITIVSSQSIITVPSKTRIGVAPALLVIFSAGISFICAFSPYFYLPEILLQENMAFPTDVLDMLSVMSLPSTILYIFITNQLRHRLNLKCINAWSIIELILAIINVISDILYILARPQECLQLVKVITNYESKIDSFINILSKLGLQKLLDESYKGSKVLLYFVTYSFLFQTVFMLIYTTMSCSIYGETQYIFTIKKQNNEYQVVVNSRE